MKFFFFFISLLVPSIVAFNCNSVTSSDDCTTLNGCSWDTTSLLCSGNYGPSCNIPNCYYVDPVGGLDTQTGAATSPFKTLKPAFTALAAKAGTIYVINLVHLQEVDLPSSTSIAFTTTLSALFTSKKFVMSLANFDTTTYANPALRAAFNITANQLTVTGCAFTEKSVPSSGGIDTIFEVFNTKLYFNNVSSYDYNGSAYLVDIQSSKTSSIFSHNVGNFKNTSFTFNLLAGTQTITNVNFYNITRPTVLYNIGLTVTFTNVTAKSGSTLFMNLVAQGILTMTNFTMTEYEGNFLTGTTTKYITLTSCTFENITQNITEPFVHLSGKGSTATQHTISTSVFRNITVRNSIFLLENAAGYLTFNDNLMTNIYKISLTKTQKNITDLSYESYLPGGGICFMGMIAAGIRATSSNFTNIHSHCIGLYQSVLTLTTCIFDNSGLTSQYESSLKNTSLTDSDGVTFVTFKDGTTDLNPGSFVTLTSNSFVNNVRYPKYGGAMKFIGTFSLSVSFITNHFTGMGALYGGAIYCENPLAGIIFTSDNFFNNVAILGGAVYKTTQETATLLKLSVQTVYFSGVTFNENIATKKGGAIYLAYETLGLYNSSINGNTAVNGGAIYFIKQNPYANLQSQIGNNNFTANIASNSGGAIKLLFNYSEIVDNTTWESNFTDNADFKGLAVSDGIPSYYVISFYDVITDEEETGLEDFTTWITNPNKTRLADSFNTTDFPTTFQMKHKSGHELSQIISIEVYDDSDQLADYITDETILTSITDTYNNNSDFNAYLASSSIAFTFTRGILAMKAGVTLVGEPKSVGVLTFSGLKDRSNILVDANFLLKQSVEVYFVDCEIGDTYSSQTKICQTCAKGTYSLADPYSHPSCIVCDPDSSICLGGAKIAPKAGYWRYSMYSQIFLECPESSACLGGYVNNTYNPYGECRFPYEGNLCNQCASKYAKFGTSEACVSCTTDVMYYVKFAGLLILQILILLYGVKCNIDKVAQVKKAQTEEDKKLMKNINNSDFQSNLMKITVNFLQVSTIVIQYNFDWPKFITNLVNVTNKAIPSDKNGFSIDCIIALITGDNKYILFIKLVVTLIQPYIMWALLILTYILYLKIKSEKLIGNSKLKKNILVLFIITAFLLQPNIIQTTLEMFRCKNYVSDDAPIYFMKGDSETECWTSLHLFWSLVVALPNFVFWTILLPLVLLMVLKKNAKNLNDPEIYARYSFVYEGLKKERYYWEFLILTRKTLIVIIFVFLNFVSSQSQAFATFLVIFIFGALHYLAWPYSDERLNRAEMFSLINLGVMVYCGMFFLSEGGTEWLNVILIIVSCLFNIVFFCYLAKHFIWSYRQQALKFRDKAKQVSQHVSKIKEKFSKLRSGSKNSSNYTNSSVSDTKKNDQSNTVDIKDLSMVLNQIQFDSPLYPKSSFAKSLKQSNNESTDQTPHVRREKDEESSKQEDSIPSEENERTTRRSKTVYNEERNEISNHSVIRKSFELPKKSLDFKFEHQDSVVSQATPDMLNEMLNLFHARRSSPTSPTHLVNSNDLPYIGRAFSLNEKKVQLTKKDSDNIFPIDEESF